MSDEPEGGGSEEPEAAAETASTDGVYVGPAPGQATASDTAPIDPQVFADDETLQAGGETKALEAHQETLLAENWKERLRRHMRRHEGEREQVAESGGSESSIERVKLPLLPTDRFETLEELGRGGMGVVLAAEDSALRRKVAIKVLLAGEFASPAALTRFQIEAQAAARLRHPGIVGVHEVGEIDGRHFLVMDLIEGESLQSRIKREGALPPKEAARIAHRLAEALQYAHTRSVLHRDMKPGNVLLSLKGEPLITDFGLAKDISREDGETPTVTGQIMGSPSYMPPEQAEGQLDRIDRRSDVFSLGATLYEMLTGKPPFRGKTIFIVLDAVKNQVPEAPSRLSAGVDRDLETICLKCLEKEPGDRYDSAGDLAQDLARYLAGEPILARPAGLTERGVKWLRRNRTIARAVGGVVAVALLVITAGTVSFVQRLRAERDDAERARAEAEAAEEKATRVLKRVVLQVRDELAHVPWEPVREFRRRILLSALEEFDNLRIANSETHLQLGDLALEAGKTELAAKAFETALGIARETCRLEPDDALAANGLAVCLRRNGKLSLRQGDLARALERYEEALAIHRRLLEQSTSKVIARRQLSVSLSEIAGIREQQGELAVATELLEEALEIRRGLVEARKAGNEEAFSEGLVRTMSLFSLRWDLSNSLHDLGRLRLRRAEMTGAREAFEESLAIQEALHRERPHHSGVANNLSGTAGQVGDLRRQSGDLPGALRAYEREVAIDRELFTADPSSSMTRSNLALGSVRVARVRAAQGDRDGAERAYTEALEIFRTLHSKDPGDAYLRNQLSSVLSDLGGLRMNAGDLERALELFEESLTLDEQRLAAAPGSVDAELSLWSTLGQIGHVHEARGDVSKAAAAYQRALELQRAQVSRNAANLKARHSVANSLKVLAGLRQARGDVKGALELQDESLKILRELSTQSPENQQLKLALVSGLDQSAELRRAIGDFDGAQLAAEQSVGVGRAVLARDPTNHSVKGDVASSLSWLGRVLRQQKKLAESMRTFKEALALGRELLKRDSKKVTTRNLVSSTLGDIGELHMEAGELELSQKAYEEGLEVARVTATLDEGVLAQRNLAISSVQLGRIRSLRRDLKGALEVFEEGAAIMRAVVPKVPTDTGARRELTIFLLDVGKARFNLGDEERGLAELREGRDQARILAGQSAQFGPFLQAVEGLVAKAELRAGKPSPLERAYAQYQAKEYAASTQSFAEAMTDEQVRRDLGRGNLYNAACAAALAAAAAEGTEKEALQKQALTWIADDLDMRRGLIQQVDELLTRDPPEGQRARLEGIKQDCQQHFEHARVKDPDLAALRGLPEFEALFE